MFRIVYFAIIANNGICHICICRLSEAATLSLCVAPHVLILNFACRYNTHIRSVARQRIVMCCANTTSMLFSNGTTILYVFFFLLVVIVALVRICFPPVHAPSQNSRWIPSCVWIHRPSRNQPRPIFTPHCIGKCLENGPNGSSILAVPVRLPSPKTCTIHERDAIRGQKVTHYKRC